LSSDTAQPIIVAGATTERCAAVGPVQVHGAGPYSRRAGHVKRNGRHVGRLRDLRDERWRAQNNLGRWYSMAFTMSANGRILPRFDYETRPMIGDAPADLAEARADLRRASRPER